MKRNLNLTEPHTLPPRSPFTVLFNACSWCHFLLLLYRSDGRLFHRQLLFSSALSFSLKSPTLETPYRKRVTVPVNRRVTKTSDILSLIGQADNKITPTSHWLRNLVEFPQLTSTRALFFLFYLTFAHIRRRRQMELWMNTDVHY